MKSLRHSLLTTVGLLSGLFASTSSFSATVPPLPPALVGSYQGILQVPGDPEGLPFGRIEILTTTARKATGKLVLIDKKSYAFAITLATNVENTEATGSAILVKKAAVGATPAQTLLDLTLVIKSDGTFDASGASTLTTLPPATFEELPGAAFKTPAFAPVKAPCAWLGAYTAAFSDPEPAGSGAPTGSGYMTGTTGTNGSMAVAGKLADGTAFTGSMKPSADGRHFLFLTPYTSTVGGYFVTSFQLTQRSDNRWHVVADSDWTKWKKVPYAKDKAFAAGFGPLDMYLTLAQWVAPVGTSQNVSTQMDIDSTEVFNFSFESALIPAATGRWVPLTLGLNSNNTFRVASGNANSGNPLQVADWAKRFISKIDPKTGVVTMTVPIEDSVIIPPATKAKIVKRTVTLTGVLFQLLSGDTAPVASGFGTLPAVTTTGATVFGNFGLTGPIVVDPLFAASSKIAGKYTATINQLTSHTLAPAGSLPKDDTTITFTVANDLSSVTFHGRTVPFLTDGRPVSILYTDSVIPAKAMNNLTVKLYIDFTGKIWAVDATYLQFGFPMKQRDYATVNGTIVKIQ